MRDEAQVDEFPVALRPQDVINSGRAPRVVFTEACYGANSMDKTTETALCLKFLDSGSKAVVGSTKISYGSVTPPLIAADLLGKLFWEHLRQGVPTGEALRRAKLSLAAEMHRRQEYLDGEDQKTLISFVLYGDPLYALPLSPGGHAQKTVLRRTTRPKRMQTACALGDSGCGPEDLDPATLAQVKSIVARYLPGMQDAVCNIHTQHLGCEGTDHLCPSHQIGIKSLQADAGETMVLTFAKTVADGKLRHSHFARLTLDRHGKVLKLAVSR